LKTSELGERKTGVEWDPEVEGSGIPRWRGGSGRRGRKREEARFWQSHKVCTSSLPLQETAEERHKAPRAQRQVVFLSSSFFRLCRPFL
jgi:hypothetical protein